MGLRCMKRFLGGRMGWAKLILGIIAVFMYCR